MANNVSMDSRELGLVLGQQLFDINDMHYGLWDEDLPVNLGNLLIAQQRYTAQLLADIDSMALAAPRVLDIGCGTGHILTQMLDRGYHADGLVPAPGFAKLVNEKLALRQSKKAQCFVMPFESFPADEYLNAYDVALFSESFQYIQVSKSFNILEKILRPGGRIIICDFFKSEHHGDGKVGDRSFGGGHQWDEFQAQLKISPFAVLKNEDITLKMSPNLDLVNSVLMNKLLPAAQTVERYLTINYPKILKLIKLIFKKKIARMKYKYFSGLRTKETFERYKIYRHLVLEKPLGL